MAYTQTEFIAQIRRRADMENSTFVTDAEIADYINDSARELHDLLAVHTADFYLAVSSLTTTSGTAAYALTAPPFTGGALPAYKVVRVGLVLNNREYPLRRFDYTDLVGDLVSNSWSEGALPRYKLAHSVALGGTQAINFQPIPNAAYTINLIYIPQLIPLAAAGNSFGHFGPWEEYIVLDCVRKCLNKENNPDARVWDADKAAMIQRVKDLAAPAEYANQEQMADVRYGPSGRDRDRRQWWP